MLAALLAVALLLMGGAPAAAEESDAAAITPPRLSYLDGPVSLWRPGVEDWTSAQPNMALAPGDELRTGHRGNVELQVGSRAFVRAWGDTQLGLASHAPDSLQLKVADGHVAVDLRALESGGIIHVETPGAAFTLDRPGYYRFDVTPQRTSFTTRREGQARTTRVEAGATETAAAPAPDAWDRWNQARTDELLHAASARHVPEGVYGVRDLDDHGDWRVLPTYGAVWVPRGAPAGWAPYTTGRWLWDPRFGWTWVDTAMWGWAPFHHGRWVYLDGVWAWAPGPMAVRPVYAPALVAFFNAPGVRVSVGAPFVSWVALGWGEPVVPWWGRPGFVGRPAWVGWGGPRVVNNVVVSRTLTVHATDIRVYRNAGVHRALVAVAPDRFGRARVEDARVTAIDARRLEPVRGPLRVVPDAGGRTESPVRTPRTPDAERARPADAARPLPRPETRPRLEPSPAEPRRPVEPSRPEIPRVERSRPESRGTPDRVEPRRPVEPSRPEMPPRVERPRPEPRDTPNGVEPRRPAEASRPEMTPRAERSRPEPRDTPDRVEPRRPVEASRPEMTPRPERSRPETPDRVVPERREREERRAPSPSGPSVKGAAARERQERGDGPSRRDGQNVRERRPTS